MKWTKEPPSNQGWFWARWDIGGKRYQQVFKIYFENDGFWISATDSLCDVRVEDSANGTLWAGPIEEPTE